MISKRRSEDKPVTVRHPTGCCLRQTIVSPALQRAAAQAGSIFLMKSKTLQKGTEKRSVVIFPSPSFGYFARM
jgi:hypothetical protein